MLSTGRHLFLTHEKAPHSKKKRGTVNGASQHTHCRCSSPSSKNECVTDSSQNNFFSYIS